MIEGLHFDVPYEEMKTHLYKRSAYHLAKSEEFSKQWGAEKARLESLEADMQPDPRMTSVLTNKDELKGKYRKHRALCEIFEFLEDHLIVGESYRLTKRELVELEFISDTGW